MAVQEMKSKPIYFTTKNGKLVEVPADNKSLAEKTLGFKPPSEQGKPYSARAFPKK